jgi:hypothetical protein
MPVYAFAYDLVNHPQEFDYEPLWAELRRLNAHRMQLSLWLINLDNTPQAVVEHFKKFVHAKDRLAATRLRPREYSYANAIGGTNDWFKRNPPT